MATMQIDRQATQEEDKGPMTLLPVTTTRISLPEYMEDCDLEQFKQDRAPRENPIAQQEKPIVVRLPRGPKPKPQANDDLCLVSPQSYKICSQPKGILLMVNNVKFDGENIGHRDGAPRDQANMANLFRKLGYRVETYQDLSLEELRTKVSDFAKRPELSLIDSLFVTVMSHGQDTGRDSQIVCRDGQALNCQWVVDQFNATVCPALKDKPKVFLFQMCRDPVAGGASAGVQRDGYSMHRDRNQQAFRVNDDVLVANATVQGSSALRDTKKGSWFIQAICKVYAQYAREDDIESLQKKADNLIKQCSANIKSQSVTQTTTYCNTGFRKFYFYRASNEVAVVA